jgi:type I restriction enzyme, S subunit
MKFLKQTIISKGTSTTLPILKKSVFEKILIPIPPLDKQIIFSKAVTHFENTSEQHFKSKEFIERLFGILLSQAFDGSLTLSWREAHMKELLQEMEEQKKYLEKVN